LNDRVFFYQNDALLLPEDFPESEIEKGLPKELAKNFTNTDIFEAPPLDPASPMINAVSVFPGTELPQGWKSIPVRYLFTAISAEGMGRILRACHIAQWRNDSRFCGRCGAKNMRAETLKGAVPRVKG